MLPMWMPKCTACHFLVFGGVNCNMVLLSSQCPTDSYLLHNRQNLRQLKHLHERNNLKLWQFTHHNLYIYRERIHYINRIRTWMKVFEYYALSLPHINNGPFHLDCEERKRIKKNVLKIREKNSNFNKKERKEKIIMLIHQMLIICFSGMERRN